MKKSMQRWSTGTQFSYSCPQSNNMIPTSAKFILDISSRPLPAELM